MQQRGDYSSAYAWRRAVALGLLGALYLLSIARGLAWPNDYSEAHWLFTYEFGFIKRGLVGSAFAGLQGLFGFVETETLLHASAAVLLAIFFAAYFWLAATLVARQGFSLCGVLVGLVFFSSPYIVMAGKLNGYFDCIIAALAILSCYLLQRGRVYGAAAALTVGVLIHENILLVGLPGALLFAFAKSMARDDAAAIKTYWPVLVFPALAALALYIYHEYLMDPQQVRAAMEQKLQQSGFVEGFLVRYAPRVLVTGFAEHWRLNHLCIDRITDGFFISRALLAPLAITAFYFCMAGRGKGKTALFALALASILLPLAMHLIAHDIERIWTYPLFATLLACYAFSESSAPAARRPAATRQPAAIASLQHFAFAAVLACILAIQNLTVYPLFEIDGDRDRLYMLNPPPIPILPSSQSAIRSNQCFAPE